MFDLPDIIRVILSVAFVTESGVEQIEPKLKAHGALLTTFAGIRNDISSEQGLKRLHGYGGKLFAVDTGARNILFHPKLYLAKNKKVARVVIGSANLTLGGLNNNIEAGMLMEFDLANDDDRKIVEKIEGDLDGLLAQYPAHILEVTASKQLADWRASGRLVDEMAIPPPRPRAALEGNTPGSDTVPRIKLKVIPMRRAIKKAKAAKKLAPKAASAKGKMATAAIPAAPPALGVDLEMVWESKALTRRDLTIPNADGTHATGSINLDKGLLAAEVDHRRYFKDDVFSDLKWVNTNATGAVVEGYAKFQLVLKGVSRGEFDLRVAHTTSTTSESYKQNNAMTRLSWGPMREYVAREDLIGRNLALYRDNADPTRFVLEID